MHCIASYCLAFRIIPGNNRLYKTSHLAILKSMEVVWYSMQRTAIDNKFDNLCSKVASFMNTLHGNSYTANHWEEIFLLVAKRISARLWMRDLFSQYTCMRTCIRVCHAQECQFALICTYVHAQKLIRHMHWRRRSKTGKNGASWQWRTWRTVQLVLRNIDILWSWVLNAANSWQHWERESNEVNVQKKPRRQKENKRNCKRKKHMESLQKPGVNFAHFHVQFNYSFELTCTARHEASCTCLLLVYNKISE